VKFAFYLPQALYIFTNSPLALPSRSEARHAFQLCVHSVAASNVLRIFNASLALLTVLPLPKLTRFLDKQFD
jgi:hypothetical protein